MSLTLAYLAVAFTEPTQAPPGGNVPAPLNVGASGQSKAGGLILNTGGAAIGLIVDKGNVGIGTGSPTEKLVVAGDVKIGAGSGVTIRYVGGANPSCPRGFVAKKWNDYTDPGFPVDCGADPPSFCPAGTYTGGWAPVLTFTGGPTYTCTNTNPCSNLLGPSQNNGWSAILCLE